MSRVPALAAALLVTAVGCIGGSATPTPTALPPASSATAAGTTAPPSASTPGFGDSTHHDPTSTATSTAASPLGGFATPSARPPAPSDAPDVARVKALIPDTIAGVNMIKIAERGPEILSNDEGDVTRLTGTLARLRATADDLLRITARDENGTLDFQILAWHVNGATGAQLLGELIAYEERDFASPQFHGETIGGKHATVLVDAAGDPADASHFYPSGDIVFEVIGPGLDDLAEAFSKLP